MLVHKRVVKDMSSDRHQAGQTSNKAAAISSSYTPPFLAARLSALAVFISLLTPSTSLWAAPILAVPEATELRDDPAVYSVEETRRALQAIVRTYDGTYTFAQVNADIDDTDAIVPEIDAHIILDNYADDGLVKNSTIRLRGNTSRLANQKSYRIKLSSGMPLWRGETTFQLNKHPFELTRVRNKLAFDLFREIPHVPSLRTQFVQMNITNFDKNGVQYASGNYGLFTHVEKMGKEYLTNRGLPTTGNIYKAEDFQFRVDDNLQLDAAGLYVNKANFEKTLSLEADNKNHKKLIEMLTALNNPATNFNTFFDKYFDKYNYMAWLASNILMGNRDTINQNFALHQPLNSDKFYLLPWDYDGAFGFEGQPDQKQANTLYGKWQLSVSNWWGIPLHQRFLQDPAHLAELKLVVDELYTQYLTEANVKAKMDSYKPLVQPFISTNPDLAELPTISSNKINEWNTEYLRIPTVIKANRDRFFQDLEKPMPYWMSASLVSGRLQLEWDQAVDLQGDPVTYTVQVSTSPSFSNLVVNRQVSNTTLLRVNKPSNGVYYLKVIARDSKGNAQEAFDRVDINGKAYFGIYDFRVRSNRVDEIL